jgi:hypothetical protein
MKRTILSFFAALAATVTLNAQQISVVDPQGATTLYVDLNLAIQGASSGSTVYLSGGGFQANDSVKIAKKLTIIGIGHKPNNDNADRNTVVSGNFFFEGGSDGSAVMGLYLSGDVNIGTDQNAVNNFLLRYCNVNSVQVKNSSCQGVLINQNYIRNNSSGGNSAISFTNNVTHSIWYVNGGIIDHNVVRYNRYHSSGSLAFSNIQNSQISNNILVDPGPVLHSGGNCIVSNNMLNRVWGDASYGTIQITESWDDELEGPITSVSPACNYQLKTDSPGKNAASDGTDVGIYGGTGFSDAALPPIPRIVSKSIADQTDANGKLKVQVQVSAQ